MNTNCSICWLFCPQQRRVESLSATTAFHQTPSTTIPPNCHLLLLASITLHAKYTDSLLVLGDTSHCLLLLLLLMMMMRWIIYSLETSMFSVAHEMKQSGCLMNVTEFSVPRARTRFVCCSGFFVLLLLLLFILYSIFHDIRHRMRDVAATAPTASGHCQSWISARPALAALVDVRWGWCEMWYATVSDRFARTRVGQPSAARRPSMDGNIESVFGSRWEFCVFAVERKLRTTQSSDELKQKQEPLTCTRTCCRVCSSSTMKVRIWTRMTRVVEFAIFLCVAFVGGGEMSTL